MAYVPVPSTAQVDIVNTIGAETMATVLHYKGGDVTDETVLTNLAGSVNALWQSEIEPIVSDQVFGRLVRATDLSNQNGPSVEVSNSGQGNLPDASDPRLPNNVAWSLKKVTGFRGRSYRGRIYHYGFALSQVDGSGVVSAAQTAILAAWNEFVEFTNADATWRLQVVSTFANGVQRVTGLATPVTEIVASDNVLDSQRRRLPGRGQ